MTARRIEPLTAAGLAAVLSAATITAAGIHSQDVSPGLRTEFAAVELQALTVSTATTAIDPVQLVTDVVKSAVSFAATALWYAAFPITLPLSVIGGLVMSVAQTINRAQASTAADPLVGFTFFFTAPNVLLTSGLANAGLATNVIQQQLLHFPIGMAAAVRPTTATNRASTAPAVASTSPRSAKKIAATAHSVAKASKRAAAARSR